MDDIIETAAEVGRATAGAARKQSGRVLVVTGRGGTGKSTFSALAVRYLAGRLLLLDIDPDQSLADMLGVDLDEVSVKTEADREVKIKTISEITSDIEEDEVFTELGGGPGFVKIPMLLQWYAQYHSEKFSLVSLGPRWTEGDYRAANQLFEFVIPSFAREYANIVVDSPAGLEHLNRKVIPSLDDLFIVLDPSHKSVKHVARVRKILEETTTRFENLYLVGNHEFNEEAEERIKETGETYLGRIDYDPAVKECNLRGESLLNLPDNSPACLAVKKVLARAGYKTD